MSIAQIVLMRERAPVEVSFFLGDSLVAWISKKQGSISLSTTEEKYIAVATSCTQILWMISVGIFITGRQKAEYLFVIDGKLSLDDDEQEKVARPTVQR
jgi:hypothetical protein